MKKNLFFILYLECNEKSSQKYSVHLYLDKRILVIAHLITTRLIMHDISCIKDVYRNPNSENKAWHKAKGLRMSYTQCKTCNKNEKGSINNNVICI